jgi:hypothetical protein
MADAAPPAALPRKMDDAFQPPKAAARVLPLPQLLPRPPPPLPSKEELGDLSKHSLAVLQEMCRDYELPVSGRKAQLVARLYGEAEPPGKAPEVRGRADICLACAAAAARDVQRARARTFCHPRHLQKLTMSALSRHLACA